MKLLVIDYSFVFFLSMIKKINDEYFIPVTCSVCMWIATSKQRTSLRRAVASDKKKIAEYIILYNAVLTDLDLTESPLSSEEVMEGKFPWSAISGIYSGTSFIRTLNLIILAPSLSGKLELVMWLHNNKVRIR